MRYTLTSGNWIEILPIQALKAKHRDRTDGAVKLYIKLDDKGDPDLSAMPLSMSLQTIRRDALLAQLVSAWSFTLVEYDPEGNVVEGTEASLPVPYWDGDKQEIACEASFGEIGIDDFTEIEAILAPYLAKIQRRPDPKGTTTAGSSDTLPVKASDLPRA